MSDKKIVIQSVMIPKKGFSYGKAKKWIIKHGFHIKRVDITVNYYRFRQKEPKKGAIYRIKELENGIMFVLQEI